MRACVFVCANAWLSMFGITFNFIHITCGDLRAARECNNIYLHLLKWPSSDQQIEWRIILIFWLFNNELCGCGRDYSREFQRTQTHTHTHTHGAYNTRPVASIAFIFSAWVFFGELCHRLLELAPEKKIIFWRFLTSVCNTFVAFWMQRTATTLVSGTRMASPTMPEPTEWEKITFCEFIMQFGDRNLLVCRDPHENWNNSLHISAICISRWLISAIVCVCVCACSKRTVHPIQCIRHSTVLVLFFARP